MKEVRFDICIPARFADHMINDPLFKNQFQGSIPAKRNHELRMGLQETANIVTVVVGIAQLAQFCWNVANYLFAAAKNQKTNLPLVVKTEMDDVLLEVSRFKNVEDLAEAIERSAVVTDQEADGSL